MRFSVLSKDHKETWADYLDQIQWAKDLGLEYSIDISGMVFGIDADYLVLADEPIPEDLAINLVQSSIFDILNLEEDSEESVEVLEKFEEEKKDGYTSCILTFKDKSKYELIY